MSILHHFPSAMASLWQSAAAKVSSQVAAGGAVLANAALHVPHVNLNDEMIKAAAAVGAAVHGAEAALPADNGAAKCSSAAFKLAMARVNGDTAGAIAADAELKAFGTCDPRWVECITEFVARYTLSQHADVPYKRWRSLDDFVLPDPRVAGAPEVLPAQCRIGIIGDWGTGEGRAQDLLNKLAETPLDLLIHLGDIYYSCTAYEANAFYEHCVGAFAGKKLPRILTLCGNHDMYSGGAPYYSLLSRIGQPASFFCLRNASWQIIAMDTGYNDFDPLKIDNGSTWVQDNDDRTDPYSELDWHQDKLKNAGPRRTILLSHHQPFTRNSPIGKNNAVNRCLSGQFSEFYPAIALWLWGHEHNQVIYAPFQGLAKGRCIGASAIPVAGTDPMYRVDPAFLGPDGKPNQPVADLLNQSDELKLSVDPATGLFNLGYGIVTLNDKNGTADYYQFNGTTKTSTLMLSEAL